MRRNQLYPDEMRIDARAWQKKGMSVEQIRIELGKKHGRIPSFGWVVGVLQEAAKTPKKQPVPKLVEGMDRSTVEDLLKVARFRLNKSLRVEGEKGKPSAALNEIVSQVERLEKIRLAFDAPDEPEEIQPKPVSRVKPSPELQGEVSREGLTTVLQRHLIIVEELARTAKEEGNVSQLTSLQRAMMQSVALLSKLVPDVKPIEDDPGVRVAAGQCADKLRGLLAKIRREKGT